MTRRRLRSLLLLASALAFAGLAQGAVADESTETVVTDTLAIAGEAKLGFGKGSIIVAPIPLKNPVLGNGVIATGSYLFKLDEGSDTSFIGAAAMKTDNGSFGAGAAVNLSFGGGRWSVLTMGGKANVNYAIYGIGNLRFNPVPISQDGVFVRVKASYGLTDHVFAGLDAQYLDTKISLNGSGPFPLPNLPGFGIGVRQIVAGPTLTWDTRDDTTYPTKGQFASLTVQRGVGLGSYNNSFYRGVLAGKAFFPLGDKTVLGLSATGCSVGDRAPFFNMCSVGGTDTLRGYAAGQYIDNALASVQGELRHRLTKRIGVVAFAGVSVVGPDLGDLGSSGAKYAGGVGVRFRLSKDYPLDFSVDQAVNRDGDTSTYVYIGQAF
ncbi:MAG: BamA/TamA family outer membrane protein [Paracoccaceae bacterium]